VNEGLVCVYMSLFCVYVDRGSSVKVKHSFIRELSDIVEFQYM